MTSGGEIEILYEDNHLFVVNKKVSDIVQGDKTGDESLDTKIKKYLKIRENKPGNVYLGLPHRLDRPVSGVVVYTKTSKALSRMNEVFREGKSEKIYWAIVKNKPPKPEGFLEHYLKKNEGQNKSFIVKEGTKGAKLAKLNYRLLSSSESFHLLEIRLITGRHHQIRVQLASMGCPIKGDLKYGFPRSNKNGGVSLHARSIRLLHPVKKEELYIEAPFPENDLFQHFNV